MGIHGSKYQKQAQVLMLALDGSGKTTLLYKLKYNESVVTVPTVGFNVETLETDRSSPALIVWDVGGQKKMRPHWRHHYTDTAGVVFVVDSRDLKRLDEARKELHRVNKPTNILLLSMHLHCAGFDATNLFPKLPSKGEMLKACRVFMSRDLWHCN